MLSCLGEPDVTTTPKPEVVVQGRDRLGECPLWDEREGALWWIDSRGPALRRLDPASGKVRNLPLPRTVGSIALRERGGLLVAMQDGLHFLDPLSGVLTAAVDPESHLPDNRFNDGRCDRAGRFWAGTMCDVRRDPTGSLYCFEPGLAWRKLRGGITIPNSLAWSPDGRTMYFADTHAMVIWAWDYDPASGMASGERVFVDAAPGRPDGSCVDAEGGLWNAQYGAGRLVRYTPNGTVDRVVELPFANPTCCCFGGAGYDTLFVTSATQRLSPEDLERQPLAGSVLALRPGVKGLPESRFGG